MKPLRLAALAAFAAPVLLFASGAYAHAHLLASSPAKDATVTAPQSIRLEFSETLEPKFSTASVMTLAGADVPVTAKVDGKTIAATPAAPLSPGGYMVMWSVVSADGHKMSGDFNFTVK